MSPSHDKKYRIDLNKRLQKDWESLEREIPEAIERCKAFLEACPENRLESRGKLKKLKGRFKGILQYDVTDEARIRYKVNRRERIVRIEYIGHHP